MARRQIDAALVEALQTAVMARRVFTTWGVARRAGRSVVLVAAFRTKRDAESNREPGEAIVKLACTPDGVYR